LSTSEAHSSLAKLNAHFYCDICCGGKANPTMNGKSS
jgi:hypothetical protein